MGSSKIQTPRANGTAVPNVRRHNLVAQLLWKLFAIYYGWLVVMIYTIQMFRTNKKFRVMDKNDKEDLALARNRLWDLSAQPFGLDHKFCELKDGVRLHYMLSQPRQELQGKSGLVIFLHGFPDSWHIWHSLLKKANLKDNATLVAVDLPGYGGSDGLPVYDVNSVLEILTEFILKARELYLGQGETERGPVVIVGHDWGTVIGYRLASEASALADRFILSNAPHPSHARSNVKNRVQTSGQIFKTWLHNPSNFRLLKRIFPNVKPLLKQLLSSGYVFAFLLPWPLSTVIGNLGDFWFFRLVNAMATTARPSEPVAGQYGWDLLASSIGPSLEELKTTSSNDSTMISADEPDNYPLSVKSRAASGGFSTKIRLYRDGLAFEPWTKSLQTLWELNQLEQASLELSPESSGGRKRRQSVSRAGLFDSGPVGAIKAPVTVLWGKKDLALNSSIALDGLTDYFGARGSHIISLPKAGHWTTCDRQAVDIWERVIHWSITGEKGGMKELLEGYPAASLLSSY